MREDMEYEDFEDVTERKHNSISVFIFGAFFLLFIAILILVSVSGAIKDLEVYKNANFVEVEATIVEYKDYIVYDSNTDMPMGTHYSTYYEYKSPNGGIYSGCWQTRISTEEEAKAQIGKKVPLYVDDELQLQTRSLEIDKTGVIIGGVFGSICLLVSLFFFIYLAIYLVYWLKEQAKERGVDYKENDVANKPKNFSALHQFIILLAIFSIIGLIGSLVSQEKAYQKYANADFVEVAGEIYEYKEFEKDNALYYATYYKYIGENGKEYFGVWQNDISVKEDAESAVGSSVSLFYDKELGVYKSMVDVEPVAKPDSAVYAIIIAVFAILLVNSLARFIRFIIRNERYKKLHKEDGFSKG